LKVTKSIDEVDKVMNKKEDSKKAILQAIHMWAKERGISPSPDYHASFLDFKAWLDENHFSHYLKFRSVAGPDYDAEMWFDEEMKQRWRR
jgi:hypothetical protein